VADVDGTLVGQGGDVSDAVVAATARAAAAGIRIGFATGRMRLAVEGLWERLRLPGPHVLHNGAEVRADGRTIAATPLSPAGIDEVLAIARNHDLYVELYVEDGYLVSAMDERARPHWDLLGHLPIGVVTRPDDLPGPVIKATFGLFDPDQLDGLVAALEEAGMTAGPAGSPVTPTLTYVNATHPDVDKGHALMAAAAHLGVALSEVMAIGDAANDASMLRVAGTAVAMGQAPAELRALAHLVAPDVDADGVATVLDAILDW
jgi:Cof subfamily protein (haloacid dehalogenase superfamily)